MKNRGKVRILDDLVRIVDFNAADAPATPAKVFEVAGVGSRLAGGAIDLFIAAAPVFPIMAHHLDVKGVDDVLNDRFLWNEYAGYALLALLFFLLLKILTEWLFDGQTPGKNMLRLRVVGNDGCRATLGQTILRNLLLPVDFFVGIRTMEQDELRCRVGDRRARTCVIADRPFRDMLAALNLPPGVYSTSEIGSLVRSLLARRDLIAPENAAVLAHDLAQYLEETAPTKDDFYLQRLLEEKKYMEYLAKRVEYEKAAAGPK